MSEGTCIFADHVTGHLPERTILDRDEEGKIS